MSDNAETTFKINDLLISIIPETDVDGTPDQIMSGTIVTNVVNYWPGGGVFCAGDGQAASPTPGANDPPLLAGVKALLRAQIAELEALKDASQAPTSLMPTTVEQAVALETKLSAALDAVRRAKAGLEANTAE